MSFEPPIDEPLPRLAEGQQLLFPLHPRELCREKGVNWWALTTLYEDGLLSFDPESVTRMDEGQEAELRFLSALVSADCGASMLRELLDRLPKPFRYRHSEIYFDWQARRWRPFPTPDDPATVFDEWVEVLTGDKDIMTLNALRDQIEEALEAIG